METGGCALRATRRNSRGRRLIGPATLRRHECRPGANRANTMRLWSRLTEIARAIVRQRDLARTGRGRRVAQHAMEIAMSDTEPEFRLPTPRILTAWDLHTEEDEENGGMVLWIMATERRFGESDYLPCSICNVEITDRIGGVAAVVAKPPNHLLADLDVVVEFHVVCRRCAPEQARARLLAEALMPDIIRGSA
jgi:hypothetical protein